MKIQRHGYHLVDRSPWPIMIAISLLILTTGMVMYMHMFKNGGRIATIGIILITILLMLWWKDVIREGTYGGHHTREVQRGLKIGMILFIISEILIFFTFFWAYFHGALAPSVEIGGIWPPKGIEAISPWEVPLLNTIILLTSGGTLTWAHHGLIGGKRKEAMIGLGMTIGLGIFFTMLQGMEYVEAQFSIADGVYGSTFYAATGLHGFHVIVGSIFLIVCMVRMMKYHFTRRHHVGFENAIWYWHFVDVVWIFLYLSIYYWGY